MNHTYKTFDSSHKTIKMLSFHFESRTMKISAFDHLELNDQIQCLSVHRQIKWCMANSNCRISLLKVRVKPSFSFRLIVKRFCKFEACFSMSSFVIDIGRNFKALQFLCYFLSLSTKVSISESLLIH